MQINQLSSTDTISDGDLLVLFSTANGDARNASFSALVNYLQGKLTAGGGYITQYSSPNATGFSVTVAPITNGANTFLLLTPLAGYAAGTIVLPTLPADMQEVLVACTQAVTTLTVSGNGFTVNGAPTTLAANGFFRMRYDGVNKSWYRI